MYQTMSLNITVVMSLRGDEVDEAISERIMEFASPHPRPDNPGSGESIRPRTGPRSVRPSASPAFSIGGWGFARKNKVKLLDLL